MSRCFLTRTQTAGPPGTGGTPTTSFADSFVRRLTLVVVLLFVTLMAIISIAWLALHPHPPTFTVTSLSVSNFTVSDDSSQLSGKYEIVVAIKNPNKKIQVRIDDLMVSVFYDAFELAKLDLGVQYSIFVEKMGENNLTKSGEGVLEKLAVKEWGKEWRRGLVELKVKVSGRVSYSAGKDFPTDLVRFEVNCDDLDVQVCSANRNAGKLRGNKDCRVSLQ